MQKHTKTLLILILLLALSPVSLLAQEGAPGDIPPEEQPTMQEEIIPAQEESAIVEPSVENPVTPEPVPEPVPTSTSTTTPAPTPTTESEPTAGTTPEPQVINLGTATIETEIPAKPLQNNNNLLAIIAGAVVALGVGIILKLKAPKNGVKNTSEEKEDEDKKCLNFKKLMEEKLNEITDLKGQFTAMAENKAHEKMRKVIRDTKADSLMKVIENAQKEYERLKKLYEECMAKEAITKTAFIFHGTEGYPEENWFPWLREKLENEGYKVFVPQFPTPPKVPAKIAEWLEVFKKYEKNIDENTVLIGHSLGGVFALRVLEKLEHPVKAGFFVGTPTGIQPIAEYERAKSFSGFEFNWDKIRENAKHFVVFQSDDDPYVGIENGKDLAKNLGVDMYFTPYAGHFNKDSGYTKFEELLNEIKNIKNDTRKIQKTD